MTSDVKDLINETIELTGAAAPGMLDADAPVLGASTTGAIYLIGLVGGKDVGKSSLVNAIVGQTISSPTSHGPGTETVIAYAHRSAETDMRRMLEREVPGRFTIVTHDVPQLRRQVLLDLPDIDSRYDDHIQITRRMLRHMLYPLWIQSIEKYADQRPQELLAAVAEGNDPANFIFCLNKSDQLVARHGADAAVELRHDYASRIAKAIGLPAPPHVYLISAKHPQQFDLPQLRDILCQEKAADSVREARSLAERRQDRSLFGWIGRQRLSERAGQLARLEQDAEDFAHSRIAVPLLDEAIPRILDDPAQRMALLGPATRMRIARWPIVNAIDSLLSPVMALIQKNLSATASGSSDPDAYLAGGSIAGSVQAAFAQLQQLHPDLGTLYADHKLWEPLHADLAASELRRRFAAVAARQRDMVMQRAGGSGAASVIMAPLRWLLTIGALLWFPIVQPILAATLQGTAWQFTKQTALVVVEALSVTHLLECTSFLLMWFVILWILLRWRTQRHVGRIIEKWKRADTDDDLSLTSQTMEWIDELLEPIHRKWARMEQLVKRVESIRDQLKASSPVEAPSRPAESPALSTAPFEKIAPHPRDARP